MKTSKIIEVVLIALVTICGGSMSFGILAAVLQRHNVAIGSAVTFVIAFLLVCIIGAFASSNEFIKAKEEGR